jgi:hypothetical protein
VVPTEDVVEKGLVVAVEDRELLMVVLVLSGDGVGRHQLFPSKVKQSEILIVHLLTLNNGVRNGR